MVVVVQVVGEHTLAVLELRLHQVEERLELVMLLHQHLLLLILAEVVAVVDITVVVEMAAMLVLA